MHRENGDARYFWWFMLFALVVLGAGLGLRSPWPADEPRFVLVAKQMWESGEWLFPHRGHELYPDKPPLYFWMLAAAYALVRDWNAAFLIPSLLAALGTLTLTYDFARRQCDRRAGVWAAGAVLCAFQFAYQAKRAQIDPTVVFFITLGLYGIGRHVLSTGPNWRWYWLGCFAAGLGVISKGVGFLALLALLPYIWMRWRIRRGDVWHGLSPIAAGQTGRWLLGAPAFLSAIALWLVPMVTVALTSGNPEHRAYLDDLLFRQTATRYVNAWHHHQPFWYYGEVILLFWLPFSLFIPWLIGPWRDAWRQRDARVWWPLLWALLVLVFFTASSGKRDMYILPALPAIALSAAPFMAAIAQRRGLRWLLFALAALLGLLFLGAGLAALLAEPRFELKFEAQRGLTGDADADHAWVAVAAVGAMIVAVALWARVRRALALMLTTVAIMWIGFGTLVARQLDGESSGRDLMQQARVEAGADTTIGLVGWREQQLLQAIGPTEEFGFKAPVGQQWQRGLAWLREHPQGRVLMVQEALLPACVDRTSAHSLGVANRRGWWLVEDRSAASCR
jgi:4-amino-4-deoxy-L-arabinose transferase-like glycosyltransferase